MQLTVTPGEVSRGFMTRLGPSTATVSADPVPPEGTRIQLNFRRPTDNQEVTLDGTVGQMLAEGGLWRGGVVCGQDLATHEDNASCGQSASTHDGDGRRGGALLFFGGQAGPPSWIVRAQRGQETVARSSQWLPRSPTHAPHHLVRNLTVDGRV